MTLTESSISQVGTTDETAGPSFFFANKMGRIYFLAMEEVVGRDRMQAILSLARMQDRLDNYPPDDFDFDFSFDELARTQRAMEELYGAGASRQLARRIGRACFRLGVEDFRPLLGIADLLFRVLPLRMRLRMGFEVLAHLVNRFSDHAVRLEESDEYFHWITERCGVCWGRDSDLPCCDLVVGLLEETLYWLSGGASFLVEQSSCIATGQSTCVILLGKQPVVDAAAPRG